MATNSTPVGSVDCPHRGCELRADVFRYAARSENEKRHRFAGKFYCKCAEHGRFPEANEYILNSESTTWLNEPPKKDDASPVAASENTASPPVNPQASNRPVPPVKAPKKATPTPAAPATVNGSPKPNRWGFFQ